MTLKFTQEDYGEVLHRIEEKNIQQYIKKQREFEKKAGSIIIKHKYNHANQAQNNFYKMFVENLTSEKSHRIKLKYIESILGFNKNEILLKYYILRESYDQLRLIKKSFDNDIIIYPNYYVNENVYSIMEEFLEKKQNFILRTKKDNKLNNFKHQILKMRRFHNNHEISNKIFESFIEEDNSIDLEDNLKNLNEESSSHSHKNLSNSSGKVKVLINNLNNKNENNKKKQKQIKKKIFKIITKNYDIKSEETNGNFKRMKSQSKPISFKENDIKQKLYFDDYLFKKYGWLNKKKKNNTELVKNNNFNENKIYSRTLSNEKISNKRLNIYTYNDKNKKLYGKSLHSFKPTNLFIYNFFKQQNLEKKKKIKNTIIDSIKEYETFKSQKIISFLKEKEKMTTKNFTLSSSRKKLNKNFVKGDGYTTEITQLKDLIKKQKLKEKREFHSKGKNFFLSSLFFNDNCNNYESRISRIKTNLILLSKNTKYKRMFPLLTSKT